MLIRASGKRPSARQRRRVERLGRKSVPAIIIFILALLAIVLLANYFGIHIHRHEIH